MAVTFRQLTKAEPALGWLLKEARQVDGSDCHFCANTVWYENLKPRMVLLVGWDRKSHPLLGTMEAYDVAYWTIYDALPPCRDCAWCA